MNLYKKRSDPEFIAHLNELLGIDGPNGLTSTAVHLNDPFRLSEYSYEKAICVDFFGLAATVLFDRGARVTQNCFFDFLNKLALQTGDLNQKGFIVKVRILLLYPYSASGQARIQAEMNNIRASITNPRFHRGDRFMEQITEDSFKGSSLVTTLNAIISVMEEWRETFHPQHPFLNHPNRFDVRFSCIHPGGWGLRINEHFFFDVYPMAKLERFGNRCQNGQVPLVEIVKRSDSEAYDAFCDHLRYIWDHDATFDLRDGIRIDDFTRSIGLLAPEKITFEHTAKRILSFSKKADDPEAVHVYKRKASMILKRLCPPFLPWQTKEVVFIACSWKGDPQHPIAEARALERLLRQDLHPSQSPGGAALPHVEVRLMLLSTGIEIPKAVITALNEATIGIVFLSPEILVHPEKGTDSFMARPNVYWELGYLMSRLPSERILIFRESSLQLPSNFGSLSHLPYDAGKVQLKYVQLLVTLFEIKLFPSLTGFESVVKGHMDRLNKDLKTNHITQQDYLWAQEYLKEKVNIEIE